jgi:Cu(I)/Ag(I) efflux system membrane fusion protein/cobalt-zinc-cadmium efflux system membrane fusion protein
MKRVLVLYVGLVFALVAVGGSVWIWRTQGSQISALFNRRTASGSMADMPQTDPPPNAVGTSTPRGAVTIDPRRQQLIGVRTVPAVRSAMTATIRAVGTVRSAETRMADVNIKLDGWIRDLFVDYTGQAIEKGQPLFTLYSPDLMATENEYLLALKTREQLQQSQIADVKERADQLVTSARQRLALWDLPEQELQSLDERRQAHDAVTFRSPVAGVVMEKTALKGMHVTAGQTLYKIADLSVVWVEADIYEGEVSLVKIGSRASVTLDAYPDQRFDGRVVYIYPFVDEKTRTTKVRYEFANRGGRLKPGMFANVELAVPGAMAVVVPSNAVLDSGAEQVVFVGKADGYFEPRKVKIGRRLSDQIQILDGIKEGEMVATGATFFLDSESQLRASLQGFEPVAGASSGAAPAVQLDITLRTVPDPPRTGDNQLEARVRDASGKPLEDADVAVQFFMPAMPTMGMPAMRNETKLAPAGGGVYRGMGQVLMAGQWETTVVVSRSGQRLGSKQGQITAR